MSPKILIVDDERNVRLNYRIALETEGYEVFEAVSAANALEELLGGDEAGSDRLFAKAAPA